MHIFPLRARLGTFSDKQVHPEFIEGLSVAAGSFPNYSLDIQIVNYSSLAHV